MTSDELNWARSKHEAAVASGRVILTVSAWSFYFADVAEIYTTAGYRLKYMTHHMEGDKSWTQGVVYDAVFEKT